MRVLLRRSSINCLRCTQFAMLYRTRGHFNSPQKKEFSRTQMCESQGRDECNSLSLSLVYIQCAHEYLYLRPPQLRCNTTDGMEKIRRKYPMFIHIICMQLFLICWTPFRASTLRKFFMSDAKDSQNPRGKFSNYFSTLKRFFFVIL